MTNTAEASPELVERPYCTTVFAHWRPRAGVDPAVSRARCWARPEMTLCSAVTGSALSERISPKVPLVIRLRRMSPGPPVALRFAPALSDSVLSSIVHPAEAAPV